MTSTYWTKAWNPITGCTPASAGCDRCYAKVMAETRLRGRFGYPELNPFQPGTAHPNLFSAPLTWNTPQLVFVGNMGDLFHPKVPLPMIQQVYRVMLESHLAGLGHVFLLLTKRPEGLLRFYEAECARMGLDSPRDFSLPNVWTGITAETNNLLQERMPLLAQVPGPHWLSYEPALGPLDKLHRWLEAGALQWVVAGGENGRGARGASEAWFYQAGCDTYTAGVPFFFKQPGTGMAAEERARLDPLTQRREMPAEFARWAGKFGAISFPTAPAGEE